MYTDRKVIHYQDSVGSRRNCILFKPHRLTDKEVPVQLVVCVSVGRHFAFVCNINGIFETCKDISNTLLIIYISE